MTTTLKPTMYGVGINDVPGSWGKPYYRRWEAMFNRCYSKKTKSTYVGCSVDPKWHHLSDFKRWYEEQGDVTGKEMDKDIISPGNKVYSPDKCIFVSPALNNFFTKSDKSRGKYLIGVSWEEKRKKFRATGNRGFNGYHDTELEAHLAWMKSKKEVLLETFILPETNERLKNALYYVYNNMEEYFK